MENVIVYTISGPLSLLLLPKECEDGVILISELSKDVFCFFMRLIDCWAHVHFWYTKSLLESKIGSGLEM